MRFRWGVLLLYIVAILGMFVTFHYGSLLLQAMFRAAL